jgi:histidine triad (HIT) family protein
VERDCLFCQIIRKERPAEFVYEDESLVVFKDAYPHAPVHLLIVPRKHIRSINDLRDEDREIISGMIFRAREIAREVDVNTSGYQLTFNVERGAGQVIFHLHLHLTGGWHL